MGVLKKKSICPLVVSRVGCPIHFMCVWDVQMPRGVSTLETTEGQKDDFFSLLPYTCHILNATYMGDWLKVCPSVASRLGADAEGRLAAMSCAALVLRERPGGHSIVWECTGVRARVWLDYAL